MILDPISGKSAVRNITVQRHPGPGVTRSALMIQPSGAWMAVARGDRSHPRHGFSRQRYQSTMSPAPEPSTASASSSASIRHDDTPIDRDADDSFGQLYSRRRASRVSLIAPPATQGRAPEASRQGRRPGTACPPDGRSTSIKEGALIPAPRKTSP